MPVFGISSLLYFLIWFCNLIRRTINRQVQDNIVKTIVLINLLIPTLGMVANRTRTQDANDLTAQYKHDQFNYTIKEEFYPWIGLIGREYVMRQLENFENNYKLWLIFLANETDFNGTQIHRTKPINKSNNKYYDASESTWTFGAIAWCLIVLCYCYYTGCRRPVPRRHHDELWNENEMITQRTDRRSDRRFLSEL